MRLKWEQWPQYLQDLHHRRHSVHPAYLVAGEEVLLVQEATQALSDCTKYLGFSELERFIVEPNMDWQPVLLAAESLSLFASQRRLLISFSHADLLNDKAHQALEVLFSRTDPDQVRIVQILGKCDKKLQAKPWVKALEAQGALLPIWPLNLRQWPGWLQQRARGLQLKLTTAAVNYLVQHTEGNLLAAAQSLQKLALVHQGLCDVEHLEGLLSEQQHFDVFALAEACLQGDAGRALHIFEGLQQQGLEAVLVLWMLNREIRLLYQLFFSPKQEWQRLGVWPRRQGVYQQALKRLSPELLETQMQRLALLDRMIKEPEPFQYEADVRMALGHMVLALCAKPMPATEAFWVSHRPLYEAKMACIE